jgi:hypothetical protein
VETYNTDIKQICKGMPSHYVKNNFDTSVYIHCVESSLVPRVKVVVIHSLQFTKYTVKVEKNTIAAIWDKVYILEDGVKVISYGTTVSQIELNV